MLSFYAASLISKQMSERESEIARSLTRNSMSTLSGVNDGERAAVIIKSLQLAEWRVRWRGTGKKKIYWFSLPAASVLTGRGAKNVSKMH